MKSSKQKPYQRRGEFVSNNAFDVLEQDDFEQETPVAATQTVDVPSQSTTGTRFPNSRVPRPDANPPAYSAGNTLETYFPPVRRNVEAGLTFAQVASSLKRRNSEVEAPSTSSSPTKKAFTEAGMVSTSNEQATSAGSTHDLKGKSPEKASAPAGNPFIISGAATAIGTADDLKEKPSGKASASASNPFVAVGDVAPASVAPTTTTTKAYDSLGSTPAVVAPSTTPATPVQATASVAFVVNTPAPEVSAPTPAISTQATTPATHAEADTLEQELPTEDMEVDATDIVAEEEVASTKTTRHLSPPLDEEPIPAEWTTVGNEKPKPQSGSARPQEPPTAANKGIPQGLKFSKAEKAATPATSSTANPPTTFTFTPPPTTNAFKVMTDTPTMAKPSTNTRNVDEAPPVQYYDGHLPEHHLSHVHIMESVNDETKEAWSRINGHKILAFFAKDRPKPGNWLERIEEIRAQILHLTGEADKVKVSHCLVDHNLARLEPKDAIQPFLVHNLTIAQHKALTNKRMTNCSRSWIIWYPYLTPNPRFLFGMPNIPMRDNDVNRQLVVDGVKDTLKSAPYGKALSDHLTKYHDNYPPDFPDDANMRLKSFLNTITASAITTVKNGAKEMVWLIYGAAPDSDHLTHDTFVASLKTIPYTIDGFTYYTFNDYRCLSCRSHDHPQGLCPFKALDGFFDVQFGAQNQNAAVASTSDSLSLLSLASAPLDSRLPANPNEQSHFGNQGYNQQYGGYDPYHGGYNYYGNSNPPPPLMQYNNGEYSQRGGRGYGRGRGGGFYRGNQGGRGFGRGYGRGF